MGIDLFWDNDDQTVMLAEFNGKWEWDELYSMLNTIKRLSAERGEVFGAIVDVSNGLQIPGGSVFNREGLAQFRRLMSLDQNGQKGPVVIYGMNGMVRSIFDAVAKLDSSVVDDVYFANSMEDARQRMYQMMAKPGSASSAS